MREPADFAPYIIPARTERARACFPFSAGEVIAALVAHYGVPMPEGAMAQALESSLGVPLGGSPALVLTVEPSTDQPAYLKRALEFEAKQP